jgi:parvulin-like peptidyl-prolyl isomerase
MSPVRCILLGPLLALLPAQQPAPDAAGSSGRQDEPARPPRFVDLRYPRDQDRPVAKVDGLPITLEELIEHIDERHHPGFRQYMRGPDGSGGPDGKRILRSDLIAPWVRQYADILALRAVARGRNQLQPDRIKAAEDQALKAAFQVWFDNYLADLGSRGQSTEISQERFQRLLADYQWHHGLGCELQGLLDFLEPERDWSEQELHDFYQANARIFGGGVTIAHILVQNRDAGTGILLTGDAYARLAEIKAKLLADGSNFEAIARNYSEDTRTASVGGILRTVERFDHRLPAAICRTAWQLGDGKLSDVVETQYGWHIIKRVEHVQERTILYTEGALPTVREARRRLQQENLLFEARAQFRVELLL